jgi:hypothetical protein
LADPRAASLKWEEIGAVYATFKIDNSTITYDSTKGGGSASVGLAVTGVSGSDGTVALTNTNDRVVGKLIRVQADNFCVVQVSGIMTLPQGNAVTTTVGKPIVGAQGAAAAKGYIQEVANAATPTAAEVNNIMKSRGTILDQGTTTAVAVLM